jgi:hypothetical protein
MTRFVVWLTQPARLSTIVGWALIFFVLNIPPFTWLFFVLPPDQFTAFSLLYLGLISITAMIAALGAWWQALQVQVHQEDDADVQEVLDAIQGTSD